MPILVHLTSEKNVKRILKSGILQGKYGVYCMPVLQNYYASYQWLRELRRWGQRTLVGVTFRVPDNEMVWFGHYARLHQYIPVVEAIHVLRQEQDVLGYELIIPRSIKSTELHKVQSVAQVVGWRYSPQARMLPWCTCPICVSRGEFNARKKRSSRE